MSNEPAQLTLDTGADRRAWVSRHLQSMVWSLGRLVQAPVSNLMTTAVLGFALAFPAALFTALNNASALAERWDAGTLTLSAFLVPTAQETQVRSLGQAISAHPGVVDVIALSPAAALEEYRELAGNTVALQALDGENPLPWVLTIQVEPAPTQQIEDFADELKQHPLVDLIEFDRRWLERLFALMRIAQRAVLVLASVLGVAIVLIVGNTIRLEIERRRTEIEISRLVGGTDSFIRRPFLYTGIWYGLVGGAFALLLLAITLAALSGPAADAARVYGSDFELRWPAASQLMALLIGSAWLGLVGAWVSVGRYLWRAEEGSGLSEHLCKRL
ncbi:MAG: FtsX-like permease family protein [Gammaproteobacteria bacterium]|nr:FtsX-like permease family protein [Gammaproteobacteria bacterium]